MRLGAEGCQAQRNRGFLLRALGFRAVRIVWKNGRERALLQFGRPFSSLHFADRSLRLESGENTPLPIGFPRSDVFRYEGKKPLRSINWAKMKRWQ